MKSAVGSTRTKIQMPSRNVVLSHKGPPTSVSQQRPKAGDRSGRVWQTQGGKRPHGFAQFGPRRNEQGDVSGASNNLSTNTIGILQSKVRVGSQNPYYPRNQVDSIESTQDPQGCLSQSPGGLKELEGPGFSI